MDTVDSLARYVRMYDKGIVNAQELAGNFTDHIPLGPKLQLGTALGREAPLPMEGVSAGPPSVEVPERLHSLV